MNILVPVDFRNTSFAAFRYANNLAEVMDAEITLMHVISSKSKINEYLDGDLLERMMDQAKVQLVDFAVEYPKKKGIKLSPVDTKYVITYGDPGEEILKNAVAHGYDLIIMGIRDKLNFIDRLTGTTANEVMNGAGLPVIMIHANTRFPVPKKAVFAFDKMKDLEDGVENFLDFNKKLKLSTDFVHVLTNPNTPVKEMTEEIVDELFEDRAPDFSFQIKTIKEENAIQAIHDYCLFEKADLLVMIHRKDSLWDLLLNKSKTIKSAYNFHLPVLVLPD